MSEKYGDSLVEIGHISTEFTAWCGKCNFFEQTSAPNKKEALREFRFMGWKYTTAKGWVCPEHSKK